MRALQQAQMVQRLKIFSNSDQRRAKSPGKVTDQHSALALQQLKNFAASFFTQHVRNALAFLRTLQIPNLNFALQSPDVRRPRPTRTIREAVGSPASCGEP